MRISPNRLRSACIPAVALLAAACAPSIRLPAPQTALPAQYPMVDRGDAQVLDRWWLAFGDAQLTSLIDEALVASTDTRLAFARLREARAVRRSGFAQTLPTGNVSASATRQYTTRLANSGTPISLGPIGGTDGGGTSLADLFTPAGAVDSFSVSAAPSWEVDLFGRLSATRAEARASFAAAYLDYEATRLSLAADVATTLFEARGYAAQLADAGETLRITRALAASARVSVERGLTAGSDADRLDADVANAEAESARLANLLDTSKRSLLVLTGRAGAPLASLVIAADLRTPPPVPAETPGALLERRPDVRSAEMQLVAATARVRIDRAALFPRLTLQPSVALSTSNAPTGATNLIWQLGAGLALPILNRPALMAQLRITEARGEQAVIQYEQAVQTAYREAERALAGVATDRRREAALNRATASARRAFDAKETGFKLGLNDLTTLLQAETTWRNARNALTIQQTSSLQNTVTAFRALGGGWTPTRAADQAGKTLTDDRAPS